MGNLRAVLFAAGVTLLAACGGGGGGLTSPPAQPAPVPPSTPQLPDPASAPPLKTMLDAYFPVGAAIEPASTTNADASLLVKHMSSLTAENVMKPETIGTAEGVYNFAPADTLLAFAQTNHMKVRGHTFVWHQTAPAWFFAGDQADAVTYRAAVRNRLRAYIHAVFAHFATNYPGTVHAWDVVNEAASDVRNAANPYRTTSPWYVAYEVGGRANGYRGEDYIADAFTFANEARTNAGLTSTDVKLMLNDYNTEVPGKRANVMQIVQSLLAAGVPIDGVGHQMHVQRSVNLTEVKAAFEAVENLSGGSSLVNHVTELDVSIYDDPGSCFEAKTGCQADYGANPPQSVLSQQATVYRELFNAFKRPSVTSVTLWGIADNHTWLNSFPVARTNRPLLFDTAGLPKWAFWTVVDPSISVP